METPPPPELPRPPLGPSILRLVGAALLVVSLFLPWEPISWGYRIGWEMIGEGVEDVADELEDGIEGRTVNPRKLAVGALLSVFPLAALAVSAAAIIAVVGGWIAGGLSEKWPAAASLLVTVPPLLIAIPPVAMQAVNAGEEWLLGPVLLLPGLALVAGLAWQAWRRRERAGILLNCAAALIVALYLTVGVICGLEMNSKTPLEGFPLGAGGVWLVATGTALAVRHAR